MNDFMKRVERVKAALVGRQPSKVTLAYADGSRRSVPILEAVEEVSKGRGVADVLSEDATTHSLLLAMLGPWDFSDMKELAGQ